MMSGWRSPTYKDAGVAGTGPLKLAGLDGFIFGPIYYQKHQNNWNDFMLFLVFLDEQQEFTLRMERKQLTVKKSQLVEKKEAKKTGPVLVYISRACKLERRVARAACTPRTHTYMHCMHCIIRVALLHCTTMHCALAEHPPGGCSTRWTHQAPSLGGQQRMCAGASAGRGIPRYERVVDGRKVRGKSQDCVATRPSRPPRSTQASKSS